MVDFSSTLSPFLRPIVHRKNRNNQRDSSKNTANLNFKKCLKFYPLTHLILTKTKNQIYFFGANTSKTARFAFWGCWQWSCCHNLDRERVWVVQRRISDLARWTLCHFQTSLLGFVHNWSTSRWSTTKKKRKPVFIKREWNHVVFSWATTLSFHPVYKGFGIKCPTVVDMP